MFFRNHLRTKLENANWVENFAYSGTLHRYDIQKSGKYVKKFYTNMSIINIRRI
jgi:hypothetical protein